MNELQKWWTNDKYFMTIFDVICRLTHAILADARLALAVCILPLRKDLLIVLVHFADGVAIIVRDKKAALVLF